ncbi:MAG: tetratricopeptide repeat protein [Sandaracinaceae bacterium]
MRNLGVGHRFPGGTIDIQDTWLEVEVRDANGARIAEAGTRHATADDDTAHRFVAAPVDDDAEVQELHHVQAFRASVYDQTIGPRDAHVVRYAFELPADVAQPLSVDARLRHRRHSSAMREAACAATRSPRGRAFARAGEALGRVPIDGCAELPITELGAARVWLGEGADAHEATGGATASTFQRTFDHALALIGDVQEHLDDARPSLAVALRAAPDDRARAMVLVQLARLEGRQGRLADALAAARRAEQAIGEHPAIDRVRGDAYAQVWQWEEAAAAYRRAADGAPSDESRWVDLARALGSAGRDEDARVAAETGLRLTPQNGALLRSRYLALEGLGSDTAEAARDLYLAHRVPDALSSLRLECGQREAACARERLPVHVHELRPARGHASSAP